MFIVESTWSGSCYKVAIFLHGVENVVLAFIEIVTWKNHFDIYYFFTLMLKKDCKSNYVQ